MIRTLLLLAVSLSAFGADLMVVALPKEIVQADATFAAAENARDEAYVKWARGADLVPLAAPITGEDARPSELAAAARIQAINELTVGTFGVKECVAQFDLAQKEKRSLDGDRGYKSRVRGAVIKLMKVWPEYVAAKGK